MKMPLVTCPVEVNLISGYKSEVPSFGFGGTLCIAEFVMMSYKQQSRRDIFGLDTYDDFEAVQFPDASEDTNDDEDELFPKLGDVKLNKIKCLYLTSVKKTLLMRYLLMEFLI